MIYMIDFVAGHIYDVLNCSYLITTISVGFLVIGIPVEC